MTEEIKTPNTNPKPEIYDYYEFEEQLEKKIIAIALKDKAFYFKHKNILKLIFDSTIFKVQ
jgi:hypothetical protein